jgi:hypothetical protein
MPEAARNNNKFLALSLPLFAVWLVGSLKGVLPVDAWRSRQPPQQMRRYTLRDDHKSLLKIISSILSASSPEMYI